MPVAVGSLVRATATDRSRGRQVQFPWVPYGVSVLVFVHASCVACDEFVERLADQGERFRSWGSTVWVVGGNVGVRPHGDGIGTARELVDEADELHVATGVGDGEAAVLVLDVHGEVYFSVDVSEHDFPSVEALFAEARFPALQCPECETPDVPSRSQLPDWG